MMAKTAHGARASGFRIVVGLTSLSASTALAQSPPPVDAAASASAAPGVAAVPAVAAQPNPEAAQANASAAPPLGAAPVSGMTQPPNPAVASQPVAAPVAPTTSTGATGTGTFGTGSGVATAASALSDHERVVGHVGFGWYGTRNVPLYSSSNPSDGIQTPLVGVRYWINPTAGIDIAVGAFVGSGEVKQKSNGTTTKTPDGTGTAAMLHVGVPLSFFHSEHHSVQLVPQIEAGYAYASIDPPTPNPNRVLSATNQGVLVQAGVAVGAEVHFGFMGLPHLALDGSVGAFMAYSDCKGEQGTASAQHSRFVFSTSNVNSPWDFFRSNIGARYYF